MADEEGPRPKVQVSKRATLQEWATVSVFNYYINVRILLEPIGILRIILVVSALHARIRPFTNIMCYTLIV